ncbi:DUF3152 domain-containing protein [Gordonia jinhuaensis]|uniref:DUF3152 domain-containing protein n=1 Tax=Gordonia jinhuaensis TaxID=1517702 RepID=A0A916WW63_9ACTN|nr:DUF3152 domain-containing protein [Gordonia jinhuaensis]GGB34745.1 hypothetical protein GCM10011489_23540 [Gordonia jinhuaensis]
MDTAHRGTGPTSDGGPDSDRFSHEPSYGSGPLDDRPLTSPAGAFPDGRIADGTFAGRPRTDGSRVGPHEARDEGVRPRWRPADDQPLRAKWDPIEAGGGRKRSDPHARKNVRRRTSVGRFVDTYGWRAYAIPVLAILTVVLIVMTIGDAGSHDHSATPAQARETDVSAQTKAIGSPVGKIDQSALTDSGALPAGGPYSQSGERVYHVVPGTTPKIGTAAKVYRYTIEVEDGLHASDYGDDAMFADMVTQTLSNPKSWIGGGQVAFQRVDSGDPDFRISLSSSDTTRELCGYEIKLESSCYYPPDTRVVLNEARWVRGAKAFGGDGLAYRQYQVNHEVGHAIGYAHHEPCRENGALAPVMMQQSFGVANKQVLSLDPDLHGDPSFVCRPNPWPYPDR